MGRGHTGGTIAHGTISQNANSQNEWARAGRRTRASLVVAAAVLLMLGSACGALDITSKSAPTPTRSADQITPPVVVTVGGGPPADATATPGTAPTIPDSTPRPRLELPTRDPAAVAPAVTPGPRSNVSAAARASQPPPIAVPVGQRGSPTPGT